MDRFVPSTANRVPVRGPAVTGIGLLVASAVTAQPALAEDGEQDSATVPVLQSGILDGLGDIIISALEEFLRTLFSPIESVIENNADGLLEVVVQTPRPDTVFGRPTNGAWPSIYDYYWETIVPLSLALFGLAVGLVIFFESTSHLFSNYHRTKLKKRAFAGLLGILSWWWIAAMSLRLIDALAIFLLPSLSEVSLFQTISFASMGVIGLVIALSTDLILFILIGLIYLVRHLMLYLFVLMMPILIVLWIPGVGPFALASRFMKRLAGFYVPFLFMTVPVALLFRIGGLLGESAGFSVSGIGAWLTALVVPFAAVLSPFVLFWQAGAILFMADRASRHVSAQRAKRRARAGRERVRQAVQSGRNFGRGVRNKPAVRNDGQLMLGSGDSRAHAAGRRVNNAGSRLGRVFRSDDGTSGGGNGGNGSANGNSRNGEPGGSDPSGGSGSSGNDGPSPGGSDSSSSGWSGNDPEQSGNSEHSSDGGRDEETERSRSRNDSYDNLRDGDRSRSAGPKIDDEPRYIQ